MTDKFRQFLSKLLKKFTKPKLIALASAATVVVAIVVGVVIIVTNSQRKIESNKNRPMSAKKITAVETCEKPELKVAAVILDKSSAEVKIGDQLSLTAQVFPKDAENAKIDWKTDNSDVATVSDGKITPLKAGKCNVTASSSNGVSSDCSITVLNKEENQNKAKAETKKQPVKKATAKVAPAPAPSAPGFKSGALGNASQVIAVVAPSMHTRNATVSVYQKTGDKWEQAMPDISALIGKNGLAYDSVRRQETDTTPAGIYSIEFAFGWAANPGTKISYRLADDNSYWDENSGRSTYNRWVEGCPGGEFEKLKTEPLYKHALVLSFNWGQTPGKGAGIFIHDRPNCYTGGCVGIDDGSLVNIMRWIDPSKNTKVLICPKSDFSKYYH